MVCRKRAKIWNQSAGIVYPRVMMKDHQENLVTPLVHQPDESSIVLTVSQKSASKCYPDHLS